MINNFIPFHIFQTFLWFSGHLITKEKVSQFLKEWFEYKAKFWISFIKMLKVIIKFLCKNNFIILWDFIFIVLTLISKCFIYNIKHLKRVRNSFEIRYIAYNEFYKNIFSRKHQKFIFLNLKSYNAKGDSKKSLNKR